MCTVVGQLVDLVISTTSENGPYDGLTTGTVTIEKIQEDESFDLVELNKIVSSSVDSF